MLLHMYTQTHMNTRDTHIHSHAHDHTFARPLTCSLTSPDAHVHATCSTVGAAAPSIHPYVGKSAPWIRSPHPAGKVEGVCHSLFAFYRASSHFLFFPLALISMTGNPTPSLTPGRAENAEKLRTLAGNKMKKENKRHTSLFPFALTFPFPMQVPLLSPSPFCPPVGILQQVVEPLVVL